MEGNNLRALNITELHACLGQGRKKKEPKVYCFLSLEWWEGPAE